MKKIEKIEYQEPVVTGQSLATMRVRRNEPSNFVLAKKLNEIIDKLNKESGKEGE